MSKDQVGTVRRSPDGKYHALKQNDHAPYLWVVAPRYNDGGHGYTRLDGMRVADWEVVYSPPRPVGTVMRREGPRPPFWEVAVRVNEGWTWVDRNFCAHQSGEEEPYDDGDGAWEVLYEG